MPQKAMHQCECPNCQHPGDHPDKELHYQMNLFLGRWPGSRRVYASRVFCGVP
jgi:hypothetical protein